MADDDKDAARRERIRAYHKAWLQTPLGRRLNHLGNARWHYRRRPSDLVATRIARLEAEIARLRTNHHERTDNP